MMKRLTVLIFLLLFLGSSAWATTYTASNESEWDTAYSSASAGDTIQVTSSWTSTKQYDVAKAITIEGIGNPTITLGADVSYQFNLTMAGITIKDFTLEGDRGTRTAGSGIGCTNGANDQTIENMVIQNFKNVGIICAINADHQTISDCTLRYCDCSVTANDQGLVWLNSSDNVNISDCTFVGDSSGECGIYAQTATGGTVYNCTFTDIAKVPVKLNSGCNDWTVSNNTMSHWALAANSDAVRCDGTDCVISNNTITQNTDTSYSAWAFESAGTGGADGTIYEDNAVGGAYLDRVLDIGDNDIIFRRNRCNLPNPTGTITTAVKGLNCGGAIFYYNLWNVSVGSGEYVYYLQSEAAGNRTVKIYNDTIYNSDSNGTGIRFEEGTTGTWGAVECKNLIVTGFNKGIVVEDRDDDGISIVHTNNNYWSNTDNLQKDVAGVFTDITLDSTEITTNPLFFNASLKDFRLLPTSPCVNTGTSISGFTSTTLDLFRRPIVGDPDMGAIERKALWWDGGNWHMQGQYTTPYVASYEPFNVSDGVGGFEPFRVSDGVGGFEDYNVVQ